jgi:hypothetical protein
LNQQQEASALQLNALARDKYFPMGEILTIKNNELT